MAKSSLVYRLLIFAIIELLCCLVNKSFRLYILRHGLFCFKSSKAQQIANKPDGRIETGHSNILVDSH